MAERKGFDPLWGCPQTVFKAFMPMMIDRNADTVNTIRSERRHGERDATERRYKTVGGRRRADQRIFSMPIFWTLRPSFS